MIHLDQATVKFLRDNFFKDPTLALAYYHCCSTDPHAAVFNDKLGSNVDKSTMWHRISNLIGDPIGQKEAVACQQTFRCLDQSHAKNAAWHLVASICWVQMVKRVLLRWTSMLCPRHSFSPKCRYNDWQHCRRILSKTTFRWFSTMATSIIWTQNWLLMWIKIVLCPVCAKDPMTKDQESIAAGNDYGWLGNLKSLKGTTQNACTPVRLYNIKLQIQANHSTNHSIAFPITGPMECSKVIPYVDANHRP
jgi:hypothetical protein